MKHILALLVLLTGTIAAHCQPVRVYSDAGSIFIERAGSTAKLTASEMDIDPVLSPSGAFAFISDSARFNGASLIAVGGMSPRSIALI